MSVSLSTAQETFETANITAGSRNIHSSSSLDGDEERALRYKATTGLSTAEERETQKALRVARDLRVSAKIAEKYNLERGELKKQLEEDKERRFKARELRKKEMLIHWSRKLDRSSFLVDQVAESERIDEEQRVKLEEEARRAKLFEERKQKIKTEIILKALTEGNDLDQLRQEKRLIQEEERRLKVQQAHSKQDALSNKAEMLRKIQEETRRRNELQFIQQRNRLALQHSEEQKRREAILMKMQMKFGEVPGEHRLSSPPWMVSVAVGTPVRMEAAQTFVFQRQYYAEYFDETNLGRSSSRSAAAAARRPSNGDRPPIWGGGFASAASLRSGSALRVGAAAASVMDCAGGGGGDGDGLPRRLGSGNEG